MHQAGIIQFDYNKDNKNKRGEHYEKIKQKGNQELFKSDSKNL